MDNPTPDPILELCPTGSVSIITGSSHTGHTRYVMSLVADLLDGKLAPGSRPTACPTIGWLSLTHGRPQHAQQSLLRSFQSHRLQSVWNSDRFAARAINLAELQHAEPGSHPSSCPLTAEVLMETFAGAYGTSPLARRSSLAAPRFLILDNIHQLLGDRSSASPTHVSALMQSLASNMADCGTTVLAFALMTKLKAGDRYKRVPDRIHGSSAWGVWACSVWHVDIEQEDDKRLRECLQPNYLLQIAIKGGEAEQYILEPDARNLLSPHSLTQMQEETFSTQLGRWLDSFPPATDLTTAAILAQFIQLGSSDKTGERWIKRQGDGRLETIRKGLHRIRQVC